MTTQLRFPAFAILFVRRVEYLLHISPGTGILFEALDPQQSLRLIHNL